MIAAGSSSDGAGRHKISLWKQNIRRETSKPETSKPRWTAVSVMWAMIQVAMAIATLVLISQTQGWIVNDFIMKPKGFVMKYARGLRDDNVIHDGASDW